MVKKKKGPVVDDKLASRMEKGLRKLGKIWASEKKHPRPKMNVLKKWNILIESWIQDRKFPLFVRRTNNNRGSEIHHEGGRILVPVDNSPAHWAYYVCAVKKRCPSKAEIRSMVKDRQIPVAQSFRVVSGEKKRAKWKECLAKECSMNERGFKLCHDEPVKIVQRGLTCLKIIYLEDHFRRLMSPLNMFVVPLDCGGLGEVREFINGYRGLPKARKRH